VSNPVLPDAEDVQGEEIDGNPRIPIVPVSVEGPVRVQQLPSRLGDARTVKLLPAASITPHAAGEVTFRRNKDPRRRRLILLSTDKPFYYAMEQESAERGSGALWPINVPLPVEHCEEFYLASADAAGTTLTIIREDWTL
jgi:hypothetical protein